MNRFDLIMGRVHRSAISFRPETSRFLTPSLVTYGGRSHKCFPLPKKHLTHGINRLFQSGDFIVFEISSKILGQEYSDFLSTKNFNIIEAALSNFLIFDPGSLFEFSEALRLHVSRAIPISGKPSDYLLSLARIASKDFRSEIYRNREISFRHLVEDHQQPLETIAFQSKSRSASTKKRINFYDKVQDINRKNDPFFTDLENISDIKSFWSRHLRAERPLDGLESIRRAFHLPEGPIYLKTVLTSDQNPLLDLVLTILSGPSPKSPFIEYPSDLSWEKLLIFLGELSIISDFHCDMSAITALINQRQKRTPAKVVQKMRLLTEQYRGLLLGLDPASTNGKIQEIISGLSFSETSSAWR